MFPCVSVHEKHVKLSFYYDESVSLASCYLRTSNPFFLSGEQVIENGGERGGDGVVEGGLITPALKPDPVL